MKTKKKIETEVKAIVCPECKDTVYSRARHDFIRCSCGNVFADGGCEYFRCGVTKGEPEIKKIKVPYSKEEIYKDWNESIDKLGRISSNVS